ncbi:MAG: thiamine-phosphate kinase [Pseudomonadota bacterium]
MDEFELIEKYFAAADVSADVAIGIGDDGAVLIPTPGQQLVTVVDTLVEAVHFPAGTDAYDIGYRAVAVNLSDIAAMGARPRWMTLALTLAEANEDWVSEFSQGLRDAAAPYAVSLVGGDTTSGTSCVVSVQVTGDVPSDGAITRHGARPGDTIYVSGTIGDAAAGLRLIESGTPNTALAQRFLRPTARVSLGLGLRGHASAAIDISDGLLGDLKKLLSASGVGGVVNVDQVPLSTSLTDAFDTDTARRFAMLGGDDYELCFTTTNLPEALASDVTAIGIVEDTDGLRCKLDGDIVDYDHPGYTHFS